MQLWCLSGCSLFKDWWVVSCIPGSGQFEWLPCSDGLGPERDQPRQPDRRMSLEKTDAVTNCRWGYMQNVINGMHAKFNSQTICNQTYNQMMSAGTRSTRLDSQTAFGFGGSRTDHSLRCGAKPPSPCPIATGAFTETVFWGDARGHRQKWRLCLREWKNPAGAEIREGH